MWKWYILRAVVILLSVLLLVFAVTATDAEGYEINCRQSPGKQFLFDLTELKEEWHDDFISAARRWNNYADVYVGVDPPKREYSNRWAERRNKPTVVKVLSADVPYGEYSDAGGYATCGEGVNPFIVINTKNTTSARALRAVAVHEVGHILGLGHAKARSAVMYPVVYSSFPHSDDIAGLREIYGAHPEGNVRDRETSYDCEDEKPVLQAGSSGECVKELQERLNHRGYELEEDGVFGKRTFFAVANFQLSRDLKAHGIADEDTWRALWQKPEPPENKISANEYCMWMYELGSRCA